MLNTVHQIIQPRPTRTKAGVVVIHYTLLNKNNLYLGPPRSTSNNSDFFSVIGYYIKSSNMESKPNFVKVHGPWWIKIKIVSTYTEGPTG